MRFEKMFILAAVFLFSQVVFISCIQEEADECITAFDCPDGFLCIDGICYPPESFTDNSNTNDSSEVSDSDNGSTENDSNTISDDGDPDSSINSDNDEVETPDEGPVCSEDTCSGFGTCEMVDGTPKCTCDEFHKGADCSECIPGYHMEALDDDENGDGKYSCVKNVACTPDPCNGGQCTDKDMTVTCKCITGYTGRWCTDCDTGYLKSTVDQKCKPDCDNGTYSCTGNKTCGINATTNEAGCVCADYYSGTDCAVCDGAHFCNNHGTCSAPSGAPICSCTGNWTGNGCLECPAPEYVIQNSNCIQNCNATCGQFLPPSYGDCQFNGTKMVCVCDSGWKNPFLISFISPECSECDTANPPVGGCPE